MRTIQLKDALEYNSKTIENIVSIPHGFKMSEIAMDNIFVMFHRNRDNEPLIVSLNVWDGFQKNEIASGIVLIEGNKALVIAPTETTLCWSSKAVSGGGKTTTDRIAAFEDWDGKANTAAQITHSECNTENYASGFCSTYSRVNASGKGLTSGSWWLPSLGEMMEIYANIKKINYALSFITGSVLLSGTYWSSTEVNSNNAWVLGLHDGYTNYRTYNKVSSQLHVRPVSSFFL